MENEVHHRRARTTGVNAAVYWLVRTPLQLFFHVYLRMSRIGREHIPAQGPAIVASNHRSFFDPLIIATMTRRPMYYVTKRELFDLHPHLGWLLCALGAFPVDRGNSDQDMIATAKELLARGELVLIFPEGTRTRPGPLGRPRRGVGRLRARERRAGDPGGDLRHRRDPSRLAPAAAQGSGAGRTTAAVPARRGLHSGRRRRGHRSHLVVREAAVGVVRGTCGKQTRARARNRMRRLNWARSR